MQLLRNLWLYCALFGLTKPTAAPAQLEAAGRIAAVTPMILLADGAFSEQVRQQQQLAGQAAVVVLL